MSHRSIPACLAAVAGLVLLGGCYEYQITIELADDGSGSRTTIVETDNDLSAAARRLLAVDGESWHVDTDVDHEGKTTYRFRRRQQVDDIDGWSRTSGTLQRGTEDGAVRLVSEVAVEEVRGAGRRRLVYRETLYWVELTERVAAIVAADYATFLRREFPALPDSLIHEGRGSMATTVVQNWAELAGTEPGSGADQGPVAGNELEYSGAAPADDPEAELGARFNLMFTRRLLQAGVDPELTQAIARATADWEGDAFDGVEEELPGLDNSFRSSFLLDVVMPAPVTGGNADEVKGNTASFRVELSSTLPQPVVLEVVCER